MRLSLLFVCFAALIAGCSAPAKTASHLEATDPTGPTGPCVDQPPGCGSPGSSAIELSSDGWSLLSPGPLSQRSAQASVWTGKELLIWGGLGPEASGDADLADGASYDPTTGEWRRLPGSPLTGRGSATAVWMDGEAMFWGGEAVTGDSGHALADGASYDPTTGTWRMLPPSPLSPRTSATGIWDGSAAIIFGGLTSKGDRLFNGATYDPATDVWKAIPAVPLSHPDSAVGAAVAWTGTRLMVWVTYEFNRRLSASSYESTSSRQAFAWKPRASSWSKMAPPPSRVSTYGADAIWTGKEVLLLGTSDCLPRMSCPAPMTGTGYAFDPTSRRWSSIPSDVTLIESVPEIWTGRAVVVLNEGAVVGTQLSPGDGAVYDPGDGKWLDLERAPLDDLFDSAIAWTGEQLIVWNGGGTSRTTPGAEVLGSPS